MQQANEEGSMKSQDRAGAIKRITLSTGRSSAAEQLRHLIESNYFAPGDRLPSERELAALLGVSRTTVREAISSLEALGFIEVRHGSGSYVTSSAPQRNLSPIWNAWYAVHRYELIHLLQVREALETKAALLAVAHAGPGLVGSLRPTLEEMRLAVARGDVEEAARLDARFHSTIDAACGNPILVQLLSSLETVLENDRLAVFSLPGRMERSLHDHILIIDAIERQDAEALQHAVRQHFANVVRDVEAEAQEYSDAR